MGKIILVTIEPWQGHNAPLDSQHRVVWRLEPGHPVCVIRKVDGCSETVAAEDLSKEEHFVCVGQKYRIVEIKEQDATKAAKG